MAETIQSFAERVKSKYPEYKNVPDEEVAYDFVEKYPEYRSVFDDAVVNGNIFSETFKHGLLGFSEVFGKTYKGAIEKLSLMLADQTMSEEEFMASDKFGRMSYEEYAKDNESRAKMQRKALSHANSVGNFFDNELPNKINIDKDFARSPFGLWTTSVARGLGQMGGYTASYFAGAGVGALAGSVSPDPVTTVGGAAVGTAAVFSVAYLNRTSEFIDDAEKTMGLDLLEMNESDRDMVRNGSIAYAGTGAILEATAFKYVAGLPNALRKALVTLNAGGKVAEPTAKTLFKTLSTNALKRGTVEGLQESIGDGMTLDLIAKNLYDDNRNFITSDAIGRRMTEFLVGFSVGGIASGVGDVGRTALGEDITLTDEQRAQLAQDQIDLQEELLETEDDIQFEDLQRQFNEGGAFETTLFNEDGSKENVKITNVNNEFLTYENKQGETLIINRSGVGQIAGGVSESGQSLVNPRSPKFRLQDDQTVDSMTDEQLKEYAAQAEKYLKEQQEKPQSERDGGLLITTTSLDLSAIKFEQARRERQARQEQGETTEEVTEETSEESTGEPTDPGATEGKMFTVKFKDKNGNERVEDIFIEPGQDPMKEFQRAFKGQYSSDFVPVIEPKTPTPEGVEPDPIPDPTPEVDPTPETEEDTSPFPPPIEGGTFEDDATLEEDLPEGTEPKPTASPEVMMLQGKVLEYIEGKFGKIFKNVKLRKKNGQKLRIEYVFNPTKKQNEFYGSYNYARHTIELNMPALLRENQETDPRTGELYFNTRGIDTTIRHELIHAIADLSAEARGMNIYSFNARIGKKMSPKQREALAYAYAGVRKPWSKHADYHYGAEFIRAMIEAYSFEGGTTESMRSFTGFPGQTNAQVREMLEEDQQSPDSPYQQAKRFLKAVQRKIVEVFQTGVFVDSQIALVYLDAVRMMGQIDPEARPVNTKLYNRLSKMISPNTGNLYLNVNDFTGDPLVDPLDEVEVPAVGLRTKRSGKKPPTVDEVLDNSPKAVSIFDRFMVPVGQLLANIDSRLETVYSRFIQRKNQRILDGHNAVKGLGKKLKNLRRKNLKEYTRLSVLISYSPFAENSRQTPEQQQALFKERELLLKKHGMYNDYVAARTLLKSILVEAKEAKLEVGEQADYFPRYVDGREGMAGLRRKFGISPRSFSQALQAENESREKNTGVAYYIMIVDPATGEEIPYIKGIEQKASAEQRLARAQAADPNTEFKLKRVKDFPKPLPTIKPGTVEEEIFFEQLIRQGKLKGTGASARENRVIELLEEDTVKFYVSPEEALSRYITEMYTAIESAKFAGIGRPKVTNSQGLAINSEFDITTELGRLAQQIESEERAKMVDGMPTLKQELMNDYLPRLHEAIMANNNQENAALRFARQFSYFSLLIEVTSTLSQLYDLPFIMYDNGVLNTFKAMIGKKSFNVKDYMDVDNVVEENFKDAKSNQGLKKIIDFGLTATGFRALDILMKNTTMDANYNRYRKIAQESFNPDGTIKKGLSEKKTQEAMKFKAEVIKFLPVNRAQALADPFSEFIMSLKKEPETRTEYENSVISSALVQKLLVNQPLSNLRMPLSVMEDPNLRMVYTMKSFMIVQINNTRNLSFNKIAEGVRTNNKSLVKEGVGNLAKLMMFFVMCGIPVDLIKDLLAGRLGYMSDYTFNSMVRVFGISKYSLFKGQREGYFSALFDYAKPAPLSTVVDSGNAFFKILDGDGTFGENLVESKFLQALPMYDVMHYVSPDLRDYKKSRQYKFMRRRMRQRGELLGFPDPFERISPTPVGITREMLGL
jgi:hypothetical protein